VGAHPLSENAERRVRELLSDRGLPEPDEVEYREESILLLWHEQQLAVVVDLPVPARRGATAA
jgi:hypothetical protein